MIETLRSSAIKDCLPSLKLPPVELGGFDARILMHVLPGDADDYAESRRRRLKNSRRSSVQFDLPI